MSGVNKSVPLDDAITEAKWMLGISETTIHDIWLNTQAERILINMSNLNSTAIYNTTLDVVEGEATLPDGMVRLLALRYCDSDGKSYGAYIGDFNFINKSNCSCDNNSDYPFTEYNTVLMINDSKLLWHSPSDAPSKVRIAYRGRRTDKDGFIMIFDYMVDAVKYGLCSEFALRYPSQYPQFQQWRKMYKAQHDRVVSLDAANNFRNNFHKMVKTSVPQIITL
jgi:hypothetical protein